MSWLWTDDIADALLERGLASPGEVSVWRARPFAVAVADGADPVEVGVSLLGGDQAGVA